MSKGKVASRQTAIKALKEHIERLKNRVIGGNFGLPEWINNDCTILLQGLGVSDLIVPANPEVEPLHLLICEGIVTDSKGKEHPVKRDGTFSITYGVSQLDTLKLGKSYEVVVSKRGDNHYASIGTESILKKVPETIEEEEEEGLE